MIDVSTYDFSKDEPIDPEERYLREVAKLDVSEWARFRRAIHVGHFNEAAGIKPLTGANLTQEVIDSYRDLGKAHYQAISHLAEAHLCLLLARNFFRHLDEFSYSMFSKSVNEFYFHLGAILDALSRLVYILWEKNSATEKDTFEGEEVFLRKRVNFYQFRFNPKRKKKAEEWQLTHFFEHDTFRRIINIRDMLTHGYKITTRDGCWPEEAETVKWIAWPHGEIESNSYNYVQTIPKKLQQHFDLFLPLFNKAFHDFRERIPAWESTNQVEIV